MKRKNFLFVLFSVLMFSLSCEKEESDTNYDVLINDVENKIDNEFICLSDSYRCNGSYLEKCRSDGMEWVNVKVCNKDCRCEDGKCFCEEDKCNCLGKECGDDGCGVSCGKCQENEICLEGKCEIDQECWTSADCPDKGDVCTEKKCVGLRCKYEQKAGCCIKDSDCNDGNLNTIDRCVANACQHCEKSCAGKQCGDDGCGESCGTCSYGFKCENYQCIKPCSSECGKCKKCDLSQGKCVDMVHTCKITDSMTFGEDFSSHKFWSANNCAKTTSEPQKYCLPSKGVVFLYGCKIQITMAVDSGSDYLFLGVQSYNYDLNYGWIVLDKEVPCLECGLYGSYATGCIMTKSKFDPWKPGNYSIASDGMVDVLFSIKNQGFLYYLHYVQIESCVCK